MKNLKPILTMAMPILISLAISACGPEPESVAVQPQPVKVYEVSAVDTENVRRFPAVIEASEVANISAKVSGQVTQRLVHPGDEVTAGDLLFTIDDIDFKLNVAQAQANFTLAKVSFDRVESSRQKNIATQADYDNAKSNLDKAKVALQQSQNQLDNTRIFAPISGTVVRVNADRYDFINAAHTVVTLHSTDNFDVKFQVPSDLIRRYNGDPSDIKAKVSVNTLTDQLFDAQFKSFSADSDRSTRSFNLTLTMATPQQNKGNLFPGMDANVFVNLSDLNKDVTILVPSHAVFQSNNQNWVWKVQGDKVSKTAIIMGELYDGFISISEGLQPGNIIVEAGVQQLSDGQAIKVWTGE
ncbi:efflux RND transporter periplasmic adaptor subunit [Reinekea sp.]|jgi:RND family efflux transporter MFP subunit|uniref:efflux RND transporter periplasmic adaptor subunit n=1 Tax=Reinekea sp. TaxID=1970455 RepID=UPI003989683A